MYNAFETILICLLQIGTVVVYLLAWRFHGPITAINDSNHQEEDPIDQQQEEKSDLGRRSSIRRMTSQRQVLI
jgi:hypothetical protein